MLGKGKKKGKIDRYGVETIAASEKKKENEIEGALVVIDTIVSVPLSILTSIIFFVQSSVTKWAKCLSNKRTNEQMKERKNKQTNEKNERKNERTKKRKNERTKNEQTNGRTDGTNAHTHRARIRRRMYTHTKHHT